MFSRYTLAFESPWYLLLLLVLPLMWALSYRSLAGLGNLRRWLALGLRTAVVLLIIAALAQPQLVQKSDRLTVVYLLDQSLSIPAEQRLAMIRYVNASITEHRELEDRVGVVVFGRDAAIEIPPFDESVQVPEQIESLLDPEFTNLASAMKLAQASIAEDSAGRVVIVSDGNQNLGNAEEQAKALREASISIDVVPIRYPESGEVIVEKLDKPANLRKGQPFDLRAVITNTSDRPVSGRVIFKRKTDDAPVVLNSNDNVPEGEDDPQRVVLSPGKNVISLRQEIDQPNFYEYEVEFVADDPSFDAMVQNNAASAFTHIRGSGQVLLIEDFEREDPNEHDRLVQALGDADLEVTRRPSNQPFASFPELQQFDTVLLANVPREHFTDNQIQMLVSNVFHTGAGMMMLGGPNSMGAGGWANTELEKSMPVDFKIKNAKVVPKGALAMIMHASELANGNHWQKVIGREALKTLGSQDYCGVLHWDGTEKWLWNNPKGMIPVGGNRNAMLAKMDQMMPGDMPEFDPTMKLGLKGLNGIRDAAVKHMIIISDGDPSPPSRGLVNAYVQAKVTVTTVAVGTHGPAGSGVMQRLANATGGKYYQVRNNKALPRIFQKEARRVARPLIYDTPPPFSPEIHYPHEILRGIEGPLPPISGYVMSSVKENGLVEVGLVSPRPAARQNPVLATWTYGLGRTGVLATDCGSRWATSWTSWENYDKFFSQMVLWSMRPAGDEGNFSVATEVKDEKIRVVVTALDENDEFVNQLSFSGVTMTPDAESKQMTMKQVAPGRYVGEIDAKDAGNYFVVLKPTGQTGLIRTGVNVPYSPEFRIRGTDESLLTTMASQTPEGGAPGKLIEVPQTTQELERLLQQSGLQTVNSFRHDLPKATSSQDAWHWFVFIGCCLFFLDVLVRRVQISFAWAPMVWSKIIGRKEEEQHSDYMSRLRSRKDAVSDEYKQKQAAARFEPQADQPVEDSPVEPIGGASSQAAKPKQSTTGMAPEGPEEESYTDRLLKAKRKVWEQRKQDKPSDE